MSASEALVTLGDSTADAAVEVLGTICGQPPTRGTVQVLPADASPLQGLATPAVAVSVSYVDGVTGGNVFVMPALAVRRLAAAMMGEDPAAADPEGEPTELELSAAGEAMNQMMAGAAAATAVVLGQEVEIGPPATRVFASEAEAVDAYELTPHRTSVTVTLLSEACRFVQLVPNAFVMKMTRALADREAEAVPAAADAGLAIPEDTIRSVPVRVWAELGRARMPVSRAVGLPPGALVDLDHDADEPIDVYVNGRAFARGRLLLVDHEWAVQIETVLPATAPIADPQGGN